MAEKKLDFLFMTVCSVKVKSEWGALTLLLLKMWQH